MFISSYAAAHDGVAPSFREASAALSTSASNVAWLLNRLDKRGRIRRMRGRANTVEIVAP
jgi:SOS-response transcriptional repressor LexA